MNIDELVAVAAAEELPAAIDGAVAAVNTTEQEAQTLPFLPEEVLSFVTTEDLLREVAARCNRGRDAAPVGASAATEADAMAVDDEDLDEEGRAAAAAGGPEDGPAAESSTRRRLAAVSSSSSSGASADRSSIATTIAARSNLAQQVLCSDEGQNLLRKEREGLGLLLGSVDRGDSAVNGGWELFRSSNGNQLIDEDLDEEDTAAKRRRCQPQ
ncbi:hypothetical protein PLESTB_001578600 [Pleodorina starrii]|uniref:Uncharacterized protein n=1 Tax=Pleodorina starrii TaxID=330485 RepID=A0A9W6BXL4_9CHLO|nr:hypothetical protein PLESTM_000726600 [Pleodorina starrii]GLC60144.1 hypothetical protein PLESTB_001578600 [Pleodorina starrii]GLC70044.1 hypothetical protein PLESTF_000916800 [Pleodorina starrii]